MPSNLKILQTNTFQKMVTDLAPESMDASMYRYMLNCNVLSTAEGNVGVVTNLKGNIRIPVDLPDGDNETIGVGLDEEANRFYYAVWNSNGYNGWYMFDAVSLSITPVLVSKIDTGEVDIFNWKQTDRILHVNVINNELLYWALKGHPARKFNINKALNKNSENGYGEIIIDEYTRANKKAPILAAQIRYITDSSKKFNRVYGSLFKFTYRFIYDDGEKSNWADFSNVAVPYEENFTGYDGIPETNNGIVVTLLTGSDNVDKMEVAMQKTNPEGGVMQWVSIATLDKDKLGIESNSEYEYSFFNDVSPIVTDPLKIIRPYSFFPRNPETQEFTNNSMIYGNFEEGFPIVDVDLSYSVRYDDLYLEDGTTTGPNDPEIDYTLIENRIEVVTVARTTEGRITIGPDVKSGNIFRVEFTDGTNHYNYSEVAGLSDDSGTIANKLATKFKTNTRMTNFWGHVTAVTIDSGENASFEFAIWNNYQRPYWTVNTSVNPVDTETLKDNGQSLNNIKLGSSTGYALIYEDGESKSLVYSDDIIVPIATINELGGIKRPVITLSINHPAPDWATYYQIVRTGDLVYDAYIQLLIQKAVDTTVTAGEVYTDLVIGSLYAYQQIHPNATLGYQFTKGDRVRLIGQYDEGWTVPPVVKDYEIIEYLNVVTEVVNQDVTVDGTINVKVDSPSSNNIGSYIRIDGSEREIISVTLDGYALSSPVATGSAEADRTYPSFEIINRRGVVRIKVDPDYPIVVDPEENVFALVEIYRPAINVAVNTDENYFEFGYKFPIVKEDGKSFHSGNIQDQNESQPALVEIADGNNYVRNRALPTNMDPDNAQYVVAVIEDKSFSDFYVSDLSSNGRLNVLDTSDGVIHFGSRIRFSNNYIEGTKINGLNDFDNLDRVDYTDKYGDIKRLLFDEGRLYIFKYLKYAWVPVYGSIITDQEGSAMIAQSSKLLPPKPEYFLWEGGVGDNPESIARNGNNIFSVSPNSGVICRLGGSGIVPISKTFGLDKEVRDIISNASLSNAKMHGQFDRKNGNYVVAVQGYDTYVFNQDFFASDWARDSVDTDSTTAWILVSPPQHGTVSISGSTAIYSPNEGFVGKDEFTYSNLEGTVVRHVCLEGQEPGNPLSWRPISPYCITE